MNIDKYSEDELSQNLKLWSKVSNTFFSYSIIFLL